MKIKVIDIFRDKFTGEVYNPGTIQVQSSILKTKPA